MVCPNCHSKKLIDVQGQLFCTACGQLVSAPPEAPAEPAADVIGTAELPEGVKINALPGVDLPASAQIIKHRRPGRPKAGRLDVPLVVPASIDMAHKPEVKPEPAHAPALKNHHKRSLNDLAPAGSTPKPAVIPPVVPAGYGEITAETWRERFHPRYLMLALIPALALALIAAGAVAALTSGTLEQVINRTQHARLAVGVEVLLVGCLYYIGRSLGNSAILYGAARKSDHRPAPISHWIGVAVNSFGTRLRFDSAVTLGQLSVIGLIIGLVLMGGVDWHQPEWAQLTALFIGFLGLAYLLTGLGITQAFGRVGLTLSVITDRHAFGLGWDFYRHHFELVGVKLLGLIAELIIIIPLVAAAAAAAIYVPHDLVWLSALVAALVVAVGGALIGAGAAVWWQAAYRQLVRRERITEAKHLLTSHQPERPRTAALVSVTVLSTALVVAATVWPWLPWSG